MSISRTGIKRRPTHPGEMLRKDFLPDYDLTVSGLAKAIGVSCQSVNELLKVRRAVSPEMALRLSRLFGNSPEFWLNTQRAADFRDAGIAIRMMYAAFDPSMPPKMPLRTDLVLLAFKFSYPSKNLTASNRWQGGAKRVPAGPVQPASIACIVEQCDTNNVATCVISLPPEPPFCRRGILRPPG